MDWLLFICNPTRGAHTDACMLVGGKRQAEYQANQIILIPESTALMFYYIYILFFRFNPMVNKGRMSVKLKLVSDHGG